MRSYALSAVLAVVLLSGGATAAAAAEPPGNYGSDTPSAPSLSGSMVAPECDANVPWIDYSVVLTDPDNTTTSHEAKLILSDGAQSTTIPLGEIVNGTLSGRVLWPGASVDANGVGNGWPGWAFENGQWVASSGNFAWTRGDISAVVEVNPSLRVALSYPPSTAACLTDPAGVATSAAIAAAGMSLPATGGNLAAVLPLAGLAATLLVAGGALLYVRRVRRVRD
ncbi:LPXTG cell wall anchor domain-containing protein [Microbacterium sp. VKM Ac-2870]|uniref:LPXTG cell wall anchor domain-containing protein n=1 Tax=Microbacterium sp. VKM Ac-2870 TaxID=2783825 RepID=UPI00188C8389|nr:LPXTG cell wall anchor domain-containing protein [Microbacterium sp. VKM Ac-2870]MBF4560857.1 LPXTG cell wall anchor domain-containing protein [Microbacterium sp. VKM Ac-2870]